MAHLTAMTRGGKQKVHHETTDDILDANPNAALNALDEGLAGIMQASVVRFFACLCVVVGVLVFLELRIL